MNKILKAIVYILILIFLYLWLSTVFDSCGDTASEKTSDDTEEAMIDSEGDDDLIDLSSAVDTDDEFESEEDETSYEEEASTRVEDISNDLTEPLKETTTAPVATPAPERTFSSDNNAPFLIVAGSFSQESNANKLIDKLRRMGYNDAEKVRFDGSTFYSVVAERHSNRDRANTRARNLKSRGVDCYVHTRK